MDNTLFRVDFVRKEHCYYVPCGMSSIRYVGAKYPPLSTLHLPRVAGYVYIISKWKETDYVVLDTIFGNI